MRVLLVGGGVTNSLVSYFLRNANGMKLTCWEKARGVGGRFATKRTSQGERVDHGAQYLTRYMATKEHDEIYGSLIENGIVRPFSMDSVDQAHPKSIGKEHFIAPMGTSSIPKHFFGVNGAVELKTGLFLKRLEMKNGVVEAETRCGLVESFDYALVSIPAPQLLGDVELELDASLRQKLVKVCYSARYALIKYFGGNVDLALVDEAMERNSVGYRPNSKIRYWSKEGAKRSDSATNALMLHTDVDFGAKWADCAKEEALDELENLVESAFPACPAARETVIHKWKHSQVTQAFEAAPGFVNVNSNILLVGDGYAPSSNFDGCAYSAHKAAHYLINNVSK